MQVEALLVFSNAYIVGSSPPAAKA